MLRAAWAPSRLRRLVRHRAVRALALVAVVAWAVSAVAGERASLATELASWRDVVPVVQVVDFVGAGQPIASAVELVERPAAMVPADALSEAPSGAIAAVDLVPGELLLGARVRGVGEGVLPQDTVAITIVLDGSANLVSVGGLVDVWATDPANFTSLRLVRAATVLHHEDRELTIAVPDERAGDIAVASLRPLTVTLVG